jgi:hypothetical protein
MSNKDKYTWLTSLLTGWGVKESWAKVLAGAIIGALVAAGVLALDSCAVSYEQSATGGIRFSASVVEVECGK